MTGFSLKNVGCRFMNNRTPGPIAVSPRLDGGGGVLKLSKTRPGGHFTSMHGPASEADAGGVW